MGQWWRRWGDMQPQWLCAHLFCVRIFISWSKQCNTRAKRNGNVNMNNIHPFPCDINLQTSRHCCTVLVGIFLLIFLLLLYYHILVYLMCLSLSWHCWQDDDCNRSFSLPSTVTSHLNWAQTHFVQWRKP